jgi:sugar lactone lactonase YvrE
VSASSWDIVVETRDLVGEGPIWRASEQSLMWVDIVGQRLHQHRLSDGKTSSWSVPEMIGFVVERSSGGVAVGLPSGVSSFDMEAGSFQPLVDVLPDRRRHRLNDATTDSRGRLWLGTMLPDGSEPTGELICVDGNHQWASVDAGYLIPNGPAFDPSGSCFYHADSSKRVIYRFDVSSNGELGERRQHIQFPDEWGLPDGMTVDRDGYLWVAHWDGGRLSRFEPDGGLDHFVQLPVSRVTSCIFAGEALDRLFVTSAAIDRLAEPLAGAVFEIDAQGAVGVSQAAFAG